MDSHENGGSDVVTLPEAARLLGVGPTTLKRWSDQGRIPHTRTPGGHRRFLRSVVLDFRALVDPRAEPQRAPGAVQLRLGAPHEWLDRAQTLADPDRMEAALLGVRATSADWGQAADQILQEFVLGLRRRHAEGRLGEGTWRALSSSLVRAAHRAAGRARPRASAPVAFVAVGGGVVGPALLALTETVLRERGYSVLHLGATTESDLHVQVIEQQQPHVVAVVADRSSDPAALAPRVAAIAAGAAEVGAELWLAGDTVWPTWPGATTLTGLAALGRHASRPAHRGSSFRLEKEQRVHA